MQIESRISSLLEYYAEMQLIFYKDNEHFGTKHASPPLFSSHSAKKQTERR